MKPLVIVGIHTDVGKSVVAAIITEAIQGYYWKPIQCGMPSDRDWVQARLSLANRCYPEAFCLQTPCSAHLAAKLEGLRIEAKDLIPPLCSAPLIIEGAGGLLHPLNEKESWADAAMHWDAHWILVHRHYLGSLNHFFLTLEAIHARKIPLLGVIFNGTAEVETEEMLLKKSQKSCLGRLSWLQQLTAANIQHLAQQWRPTLHTVL